MREIEREVIRPGSLLPASGDDELLAYQLKEWLRQRDAGEWANKKTAVDGVVELRQVRRWEAFKLLKRLWRCGLITRMGVLDPRSHTPIHQLFRIESATPR